MRRIIYAISAIILLIVGFCEISLAVPLGRVLEWKTGISTVVFDGRIHAEKGLRCNDCHPHIFMMKKDYRKMKMVEIIAGKYCGACHNGKKAFASNTAESCSRCHKKM